MTRTFIIAEVGVNHNGSLDTALRMVRALAPLGVNAVKFQLARPENVYSRDAFKADYQKRNDGAGSPMEMSRRLQLPFEAHRKLYEACREEGVAYMCSAFDLESLRFIDRSFDLPYFKIASGEILSIDMLEYMARRDRKILMSTGMAEFEEIAAAIKILKRHGDKDITLLHCVSNYPAPLQDVNLNVLRTLGERLGLPVGYSDHTIGPECCIAAVAMGACVIEKHVTPDKSMPGPDHQASATIDELASLVESIRRVECALGSSEKIFSEDEKAIRRMARKSIVAVREISAGKRIEESDLCFKRPGTGFPPTAREEVIGRVARHTIACDSVIHPDDLE